MIKIRLITTKAVYFTDDIKGCHEIKNYPEKVSYGAKPSFPKIKTLDNKEVYINPQYVVSIEKEEIEEKIKT